MERMTKQRKAIIECLKKANRPLSIEEILEEVSLVVQTINLSTLYRNIKMLITEKTIQAHELPGSNPRYGMMELEHTHHFLCEACNRLFNIHVCPKDIASMLPPGFVMHSHSITLSGLCRDCNFSLKN